MHNTELGKLSEKDYENVLIFIKRFFICYKLLGRERSNVLTDLIAKYAQQLEAGYSAVVLTEFLQKLRERMPVKERFNMIFQELNWSKKSNANNDNNEKHKIQLVLELYEQAIRKNNSSLEFTIEHILPDAQSIDNANIGNMLPLEKDLNEKCKDKSLKDKIPFYKKSSFKAVQNFVSRYKGEEDSFNIDERRADLSADFYDKVIK